MTSIRHQRPPGPIQKLARRLWAVTERLLGASNTCDRCRRPMLDYCDLAGERICILCVAEQRASQLSPIAPPELAGCAAVLRALLLDLETITARPYYTWHDQDHHRALIEMTLNVAWWMTPPNLRVPGHLCVDEAVVLAQLQSYEERWGRAGKRHTDARSLTDTFDIWRTMQQRAALRAERDDVDRRYAVLRKQASPADASTGVAPLVHAPSLTT